MTLETLLNRPVTIVNRSGDEVDEYGGGVPAEAFVETVGELQQQRRTEPGDQGELSDTTWALFLPAGTVIGTGDQVLCDGDTYEVVGAPWAARNPRLRVESHVEATLRRTATGEAGS